MTQTGIFEWNGTWNEAWKSVKVLDTGQIEMSDGSKKSIWMGLHWEFA